MNVRTALAIAICLCLTTLAARGSEPARFHPIVGPTTIPLGKDLATLQLPAGFVFLNKEDAIQFLKQQGGFPSDREVGLVGSQAKGDHFLIIIEFQDLGYVRDDDAGKLDADALLKSFQEGTEANNEERRRRGIPELHVTGWSEKPHYESASHEVLWGLIGKSTRGESINYFTRKLGRKGVLSLNLVTGKDRLEENQKKVSSILQGTQYVAGQRYEDYQPGKDKDSGKNLTNLILGGSALAVAAKMGIFAKLTKLVIVGVLAMKKLVIVLIAGIASLLGRLGKKKNE